MVSGATEGSRNTELFKAAYQLRDAGYSQSEAEGQLVPRSVAAGCSEREALATIRSAFSRPARDPIPSPQDQWSSLLIDIVGRLKRRIIPTPEQIAAAVRACAVLDPVAWAGMKVGDLDRLYRVARHARKRSGTAPEANAECYVLSGEVMVYEGQTERGTTRQIVADWHGQLLEALTQVEDDDQVEHFMRLQLTKGAKVMTIDIPAELFGDPNGLARCLAHSAGAVFTPRAGMHKHLAAALLTLSGDLPERRTYHFLGWTYVAPGISVNACGTLIEPPEVELEQQLRDCGLR